MDPAAKPTIVLVLQGGGALGAYQIGAYQALQDGGYDPNWITGISIGAINAAILAGNPPAERLNRLEAFWHDISREDGAAGPFGGELPHPSQLYSFWQALVFGQPNFFAPRLLSPYLAPPGTEGATSFYDTAPLHALLDRLTSFDLIDAAPVRLSMGATDVQTGALVFFDNTRPKRPIRAEHVMASSALPPGFPAVSVDGRTYWDGGCVSNTPLEAVMQDLPTGHTIVFMIDLWSPSGPLPATIDNVLARSKQIQYATRTIHGIEAAAAKLDLRCMQAGPEDARRIDIVHIVHRPAGPQLPSVDAEFSRVLIAERRQAGFDDLRKALEAAPWASHETGPRGGAIVHRVSADGIFTQRGIAATAT